MRETEMEIQLCKILKKSRNKWFERDRSWDRKTKKGRSNDNNWN